MSHDGKCVSYGVRVMHMRSTYPFLRGELAPFQLCQSSRSTFPDHEHILNGRHGRDGQHLFPTLVFLRAEEL